MTDSKVCNPSRIYGMFNHQPFHHFLLYFGNILVNDDKLNEKTTGIESNIASVLPTTVVIATVAC